MFLCVSLVFRHDYIKNIVKNLVQPDFGWDELCIGFIMPYTYAQVFVAYKKIVAYTVSLCFRLSIVIMFYASEPIKKFSRNIVVLNLYCKVLHEGRLGRERQDNWRTIVLINARWRTDLWIKVNNYCQISVTVSGAAHRLCVLW